jgi:arylsulfatase A-like enzyme
MLAFASQASGTPPNFVVIVLDDISPADVRCYGIGSDPAPTPNLDRFAREGLRFERATAYPVCSPSRAAMLTGRFAFRTGIGTIVKPMPPLAAALPLSETLLPEALATLGGMNYATAAIGKWQLSNDGNGGTDGARVAGFHTFRGNLYSLSDTAESYFAWSGVHDGVPFTSTTYNTTWIVDRTLEWVGEVTTQGRPFFAWVALNAPHAPYHAPPLELLANPLPPFASLRQRYKAMIEAADTEIGRLVAALPAGTVVFVVGDNGTPGEVAAAPIVPTQAKITLYEGGLRVPLVVRGGGIVQPGRVIPWPVHVVDIFTTILALTGANPQQAVAKGTILDGVDLSPHFFDPSARAQRDFTYSEFFAPNGKNTAKAIFGRTMTDLDGYKLIETSVPDDALYGNGLYYVAADPFEGLNLLLMPALAETSAAQSRLHRRIEKLLATDLPSIPKH